MVRTRQGDVSARAIVSATGTWTRPFWPHYSGADTFTGQQLHTVQYRRPEDFTGRRVAAVGGGNSGAQVLAEVSAITDTLWVTNRPPRFLPDEVDGRALFAAATQRVQALHDGTITRVSEVWVTSSWFPASVLLGSVAHSRRSRCSAA